VRTFVKFTGITDEHLLTAVPDGGAAGFVVDVPTSPHNLSIEAATALVEKVAPGVEVWAVTASPPAGLVHRLFDEMGVDRIQIYGTVPSGLEFLETHHIVPSLPIRPAGSDAALPRVPTPEEHPILHLDSVGDPLPRGSPDIPDWEACRGLVDAHPGRKLVLAGGLTVENVEEALLAVRPWGLDVSKGVQGPDGNLDPKMMQAFLAAVAQAERSLG
jgi:phosphoribosylanthranilate isomerase